MATAGALQDATFRTNGTSDFNNPSNWVEGYVPTGIATVPKGVTYGALTFSKPATTFAAFNALGYTGFTIAASQTVTLTGAGVVTPDKGNPAFGVFGTLVGNVRLDGTQADASKLYGTGTIKGNVENLGGTVNPGDSNYGGSGSLTIDGFYLQKSGGQNKFTSLDIGARPGRTPARLSVTGQVKIIKEDNTGLMIITDGPAAANVTFIALSGAAGLSGVFEHVGSTSPQRPDVRYDANNVSVTI